MIYPSWKILAQKLGYTKRYEVDLHIFARMAGIEAENRRKENASK